MPNIESAIKRVRTSEKANVLNNTQKSAMRTAIKKYETALAEGADNSEALLQDAIKDDSLDFVLVNAPSSNLVNYEKEKDLKYKLSLSGIKEIVSIQKAVLDEISALLKVGGEFVYYTNTVNKDENERVIISFLENNSNYKLIKEVSYDNSEVIGYIAYLRKVAWDRYIVFQEII